MEVSGGPLVGDGQEGRTATPTASRPMTARQGSIAEVDHTCFRVVRVNELLFVYLGLIFASLMRPVSSLSLFYFLCLLIATPLYSYSRWFTVTTRKRACISLFVLSISLLVIQTIMVTVWLCTHSGQAEGALRAVLGERHVGFFLFSYLARDLVVATTSGLATAALKLKEAQGMTHREAPVTLLPPDSALAQHWRTACTMLLIIAGVTFPCALSLPYYLAYLLTASAWALDYFKGEDGGGFQKKWESVLSRLGVAYTFAYLVLIYIFQIPGAAWSTDLWALRRMGVINLSELESGAGGGILAVFVVHTSSLFLLYGLAASVLAADLLTPTTPAALPAATSSAEQPGPQHPWLLVKCERVLGCCGLYLCLGAYLVLALRRPTALGLVFMAMVTVAAALPHAAFRRGAPVLLAYTAAYSTAVYWFGAVIGREQVGGPSVVSRLVRVGLPPIDAFGHGWVQALVPLLMTTVLALAWRFRPEEGGQKKEGEEEEDLFTLIWGHNPEWRKYLCRYLASYDATLYVCLALSFGVGLVSTDALHLPFILASCLLMALPTAPLARYAWPLLVMYTQAFILILYWRTYRAWQPSHHTASASPRPLHSVLLLPVALFILSCRQLSSFLQHWHSPPSTSRQGSAREDEEQEEGAAPAAADSTSLDAELLRMQKRAARVVNLWLYVGKQASRVAIVGLLWHMAFHTPLNIFAVGYLLLLSAFPVLFIWLASYQDISRMAMPVLFRLVSVYCGVVVCLIYVLMADNLSGVAVERHVGHDLQAYGRSFIVLNWVLQALCATQTELLRNQVMDLHATARRHPQLLHALKQVLPFSLLVVIFVFVWEYISLFGALLLYLGILNAVLGRKVEGVWRAMLLSSICISVLIVLFDLAALSKFASPTLFWLGLRRGDYVPNPDRPGTALNGSLSGWQLSPSAERYMIIAYLAALQFFYNTGSRSRLKKKGGGESGQDEEEEEEDGPPAMGVERGLSRRHLQEGGVIRGMLGISSSHASPECARRGSFIDNTRAVAPVVTSVLTALSQGVWDPQQQEAAGEDDGPPPESRGGEEDTRPARAVSSASSSVGGGRKRSGSIRAGVVRQWLWTVYGALHAGVRALLSCLSAHSFEVCVLYVVVAVVLHADLVSLLYLALFLLLTTRPRPWLEQHWRLLVHALAVLVMCEYLVVLRLPPALASHSSGKGLVARLMGSRQCSLFAKYADHSSLLPPEEHAVPYSYGQWLGLCISDTSLLLVDFVMLMLSIIQSKRFRADKLPIEQPLFSRLVFAPTDPEGPVEDEALSMGLWAYLVLRYGAYLNMLVIFVLSTLTFNLVSLGYLLLVAAIVGNHPQQGLFTKRRWMWAVIAAYAAISLSMRVIYQLPAFPESFRTNSIQVLLGLRKAYASALEEPDTPAELVIDAVILMLVVVQRRIFLSPDFQKIIDELWYAESFEYAANGFHVVNELEKIREVSMAGVRSQIRTMYEHLETLAQARKKVQDDTSWELHLLKNRNAALAGGKGSSSSSSFRDSRSSSAADQEDETHKQQQQQQQQQQQTTTTGGAAQQQQQQQQQSEGSEGLPPPPSLAEGGSGGGGGATAGGESSSLELVLTPSLLSGQGEEGADDMTYATATSSLTGGPVSSSSRPPRASSPPAAAPASSSSPRSHRPQWSSTSLGAEEGGGKRREEGATTPTHGSKSVSAAVYEEVTQGLHGAGEGLSALTSWVSIHTAPILELKDPLLASREPLDGRSRGRTISTCSTFTSKTNRGMSMAVAGHDFLPPPQLLERDGDEDDEEDGTRQGHDDASHVTAVAGGGRRAEEDSAAASTGSASPPPIPLDGDYYQRQVHVHHHQLQQQDAGKRQQPAARERRHSRLETIVGRSVEMLKRPDRIQAKATRVGLRLLQSTLLFLNSRSTSMVYTILVVAHMYQPSLLSLLYPASVFGYALLQNPRCLPQIGGSLLHPMVQNPPRHFWNFLLCYAFTMLLVKFIYQFPYFCVCANSYSSGASCPSRLSAYSQVCRADDTPKLDYYIHQPVVWDYALGVYKVYKSLPWNQMSLRYEPVHRFVPSTPPGQTSEELLESGLHGAFLLTLLGDVLVLFSVLWHAHVLKIRGVWLCRDPDDTPPMAEEEQGGDVEAARAEEEESAAEPDPSPRKRKKGAGEEEEGMGVAAAAAGGEELATPSSAAGRRAGKGGSAVVVLKKQMTLEEKVGAVKSLARRGFKDYCQVFLPSGQKRAKPGVDLYVPLFFLQCFLFLFVLLAYQQAQHLFQAVKENQISGGFIIVLLLHFVVIVLDRCIYLHRSVMGKTALQLGLLLAVLWLLHSNFTFRMGISQHGPVFAWYLIMCLYFFLSGLQIGYGYPPFIETNWLTKRVHHAWGNVFRIYRAIPFLYELRMLLDWTCTPTTLYLGEWIKLEDIFSGLYIGACNLHFMECEQRRKGQPQPLCRKWGTGFLFFALLNLLVWLPLFIFSTGSLSNYDNQVTGASMTVQVDGFPTLYSASTADYVSPLLPSDTWSRLAQANSALRLLPATSTNDYMRELQYVRLPTSSQQVWQISPPAERDLLALLNDPDSEVGVSVRFDLTTQDGASNVGSALHRLSDGEKAQLAGVITGNHSDVRVSDLLPSVIRVSATKEVTPLLAAGDARPDCLFTFRRAVNGTAIGWWELACAADLGSCDATAAAASDGSSSSAGPVRSARNGSEADGCEPSMYTISSQKTIGSFVSFGYGIIGLYFTVVFTIGRFVHMSVMGMKTTIMYDDLPRVQVLYELVLTIYLARMYRNLALEEELYRELIDIYRRPQMIYERTGPYRHWLVKDEAETSAAASHLRTVEEELKKYK